MAEDTNHLFARDGHLGSLIIDRWLLDELTPSQTEILEAHVVECGLCARRLERVRAFVDDVALSPPADRRSVGSATIGWLAAFGGLSTAAGVVLALVPGPRQAERHEPERLHAAVPYTTSDGGDELAARGSVAVAVSRRWDGDVAVEIRPRVSGHLVVLVVGHDGDTDGDETRWWDVIPPDAVASRPVRAGTTPLLWVYPGATTGAAEVVAIWCPESFSLDAVLASAPEPGTVAPPPGCTMTQAGVPLAMK